MSAKYILALDQGTTSSRAIVFDHDGHVRALAQREFTQHFPHPGWVEHDAGEIWRSQLDVARETFRKSGIAVEDVAAIGITNQRETTILWDRATGKPIHNAIVWQDRRTSTMCDDLRAAGREPDITSRTGLLLDPYFSATKLRWLLDHVPQAGERAARGELAFGTVDAWLIWNLTGGRLHMTDASNASRTLLYNIHRQEWDDTLLDLFGIPRAILPEVRSNSEVYAHTDAQWFGMPIAIAGSAGDQHAATFGQACLSPGMAKNTYGTGCFMLMNTGAKAVPSSSRLLTTTLWQLNDRVTYALEGSVFMGGAIIQWLRDALGIIATSADVEGLAASVPSSEGVTLIPAFAGLGAPWWKPDARAALVGMTRGSTRAHIARAALEAIALQSADLLVGMERDAGRVGNCSLAELRVDGGAARNNLLMQIQADLLGVPVVRPRITETTALGAAYLAGLAVNFWESQEAITARWEIERRFEPTIGEAEREDRLARWRAEVQKSL